MSENTCLKMLFITAVMLAVTFGALTIQALLANNIGLALAMGWTCGLVCFHSDVIRRMSKL